MNEQPRKTETDGFVLQIRKIGNSVGLILPKELLARLNLHEGDKLHVAEFADGTLNLSARDPQFAKGMESANRAIKRYRNALAELAK
ncbi:MAG: AbrB family transcriptional regulator [Phreatobacter sp.]|uniref:AbrB/MazE/SpoVT family DNA-binding domain-containing protein n=1 Tax=Phreatobacter sp. TaxID=1966341 RepID=UPI001A41CA04|nr:AbrB family transcriptional regulator [Phreatobacter sp.]MBL8567804.1 AbrB family transcriptional regulator [Phreatobacter sp.]